VLENARKVRIRDDFLDDSIAAVGIFIDLPITERMSRKTSAAGFEITPFFMEKCLSIRDKELEVPDLRTIYGGIVNFSDDAVP